MTYEEYSIELTAYNKAMSVRKSLLTTIRMNKGWITGNNPRSDKRRDKIKRCQIQLDKLTKPIKPQKQYGFNVTTDEDVYFAPTTDMQTAIDWTERDIDCPYTVQTCRRQIMTDHQGLVW